MDIIIGLVKYTFVALLGVELVLMVRALVTLAREKARASQAAPAQAEE
ncbi:MAG TPA: hypothetical protein VNL77_10805 [Roseiflexaceae bacterium]|nr:hypothetical protein [Roseiflexaceae bacterium]